MIGIKAAVCAAMCLGSLVQAQVAMNVFSGSVSGILQGEDGSTIAGGIVELQPAPPFASGKLVQAEWTTVSTSGGAFSFADLGAGSYVVCAQVPNSPWLNPCEWGAKPTPFFLSAVQPAANITMVLKKGVVVPIRIDDPAGLVAANEGKVAGAHLLIGVPDDVGAFRMAALVSADAAGRNYQLVVPFNRAVNLSVFSSFFQLADANGLPLPGTAASQIPISVPSGQTVATVRLTVKSAAAMRSAQP